MRRPSTCRSPSSTLVLAWSILGRSSIQIGTPTSANAPIPLARLHGVVLVRNQSNVDTALWKQC
jgi:hypothetical protein